MILLFFPKVEVAVRAEFEQIKVQFSRNCRANIEIIILRSKKINKKFMKSKKRERLWRKKELRVKVKD